jgi:hypothetical protein
LPVFLKTWPKNPSLKAPETKKLANLSSITKNEKDFGLLSG